MADVEVLADPAGRPFVALHGEAGALGRGARFWISVTHEDGMAQAFAVMESEDAR